MSRAEEIAAPISDEDLDALLKKRAFYSQVSITNRALDSIVARMRAAEAALATADAAGFARGVEASAGVADEVSGRDDVPLLLRKSIWVAVRKDCASEIAAAIRALVTP